MNQNETPSSSGSQESFSHDEISNRAREIWERFGRPQGRDEEIWYEAERSLGRQKNRVGLVGENNIPFPEEVSSRDSEYENSSNPSPPLSKGRGRLDTGPTKAINRGQTNENRDDNKLGVSGDIPNRRRSS